MSKNLDADDPRLIRGPSKAKRYDALSARLDALTIAWKASTNPVLLAAAEQLDEAIGQAGADAWDGHIQRLSR